MKSPARMHPGMPIAIITALFLFAPDVIHSEAPAKNNPLLILHYPLITNRPKGRAVTKANFINQMEMFKSSGYVSVGLEDVLDFYYRNKPLPEKAVLITFAGGRKNLLYAGPVLKKLGLRAAVFLNIQAMKKANHSEVSWHDALAMEKTKSWDLAISAKTEDEAIESKRYLEKRFKALAASALSQRAMVRLPIAAAVSRPYGIGIEKIKTGGYLVSFINTHSDGYNTSETSPYNLNMIIVSADWDGKGLLYFLDNAASRQGQYIDDFSKPSNQSDWLNTYGLAFVKDGKLNLRAGPFKNGAEAWLAGTRNWSDCGISAEFRIRRGRQFWIYARYKDNQNYIRFGQDDGIFYLQQRLKGGKVSGIKSGVLTTAGAAFNKVKLIVKGSYCLAYLDGKRLFRQPLSIDASLDYGKIGLSAWDSSPGLAHCQIDAIEAGELKGAQSDYPDLTAEAVEDIRKIMAGAKISPSLQSSFYYFEDNKDRAVMKWQERFKYNLSPQLALEPSYARAILKGEGMSKIGENEYSLSAYYKEGFTSLRLAYFYRDFSSANEAHNFLADLKFPLLFIDSVNFISSYENIETAKAVQAKAKMFRNSVALYKDLPYNFRLYGRFQHAGYNDDNERNTVKAELYYLLFKKPDISVGYEFTYDNTKFSSSNYYSPDNLIMNQAGLRLKESFFKHRLSCDIGYGLGYATEEGAEGRTVHSAGGNLRYRLTAKAELFASLNLSRTPTYASRSIQAGLKYRF
ncbi:MAG: hypothetical protein A3J51_02870 [Omnitrophica WOR_2 bacterium RIFCSPHIGHO2_02_FULL_45_21]|nr:MAG: hypothetical protein A3J51_02870 [Omnitrophica WOR_2 bacterium RIFCSPHIGHO2_02_FULL_45_21]